MSGEEWTFIGFTVRMALLSTLIVAPIGTKFLKFENDYQGSLELRIKTQIP
jgi:hypothetical protein